MKKTPVLVAAGIVLAFGSAAFAEDHSGFPEPPTFHEVDADGDQMVTQDEFHAFMEERHAEHRRRHGERSGRFNPFDRADVDRDGILNQEEFDEMMQKMHRIRTKMREERGADPIE